GEEDDAPGGQEQEHHRRPVRPQQGRGHPPAHRLQEQDEQKGPPNGDGVKPLQGYPAAARPPVLHRSPPPSFYLESSPAQALCLPQGAERPTNRRATVPPNRRTIVVEMAPGCWYPDHRAIKDACAREVIRRGGRRPGSTSRSDGFPLFV